MRLLVAATMLVMVAAASAQTQWMHELIYAKAWDIDRNSWNLGLNHDGVPAYTLSSAKTGNMHVFRYKTDLNKWYLPSPSAGYGGPINDFGDVAFKALTTESIHVIGGGGHDYFTEVFGNSLEYNVTVRYIDNQGRPLWYKRGGDESHQVFRGSEELSAGRNVWVFKLLDMNRQGDAVWSAWEEGSDTDLFHLYLNDRNVSRPLVGPNGDGGTGAINDHGDLLWGGGGDYTGGFSDLFLNDVNLTADRYPYPHYAGAIDMSNSGHLFWSLYMDNQERLMLDFEDISSPVFGGHRYRLFGFQYFLSESGDVLWKATDDETDLVAIFRNREDISSDVLGDYTNGGGMRGIGMDDFGNALWEGAGSLTGNKYEVFVNTFNLSRDALPDGDYAHACALAIGGNGHVLWKTQDANGIEDLYLSTPVPEPSMLLLALPLLLVACRRPRRDCPSP
jgi:hypothetical protein